MDNKRLEQDLRVIRLILSSEEDSVQLPDSLRSENLLHLIADEPSTKKKPISIKKKVLSRKAKSLYGLAIAAALILMVVPSLIVNFSMNKDVSQEISVESETEESAIMVSDDAPALGGGVGAETKYDESFDAETETEAQRNSVRDRLGDSTGNGSGSDSVWVDVETGGAEPQEESVADEPRAYAAAPAMAPRAMTIGASSYYLNSWNGYSARWRTSDPNSNEFNNFLVVVEITSDQDGSIVTEKGFTDIYMVSYLAVKSDTGYLLGEGEDGVKLYKYSGLSNGKLKEKDSKTLEGGRMRFTQVGDYLYVITVNPPNNGSAPGKNIVLPGSDSGGAILVYALDTSTGDNTLTSIVGTTSNIFRVSNDKITFEYVDNSGATNKEEISLSGLNVNLA